MEQYCAKGSVMTYNGCVDEEKYGYTNSEMGEICHGGYSEAITVNKNFLIKVDKKIPLEAAGPIFCAGITMYSPLKHFGAIAKDGSRKRVGIWGFGGLGHMGVKLAAAAGCHVTVLSRGDKKREKATAAGAKTYINTKDPKQVSAAAGSLDLIIDTVSCNHDMRSMMSLLDTDGVLCLVGLPADPIKFKAFDVVFGRKRIAGSLIGGIAETQEVCDFVANNLECVPDVEVIKADQANWALHMLHTTQNSKSRYVVDCCTIADAGKVPVHQDFKVERWVNKENLPGGSTEEGMIKPAGALHPDTFTPVEQEDVRRKICAIQ